MTAASVTTAALVATDGGPTLPQAQLSAIPEPPAMPTAVGAPTGFHVEFQSAPVLNPLEDEPSKAQGNLLIESPYITREHLLDLSTLDTQNRLLAQALTTLTPVRPDYATAPYTESFNWDFVFLKFYSLAAKEGYSLSRQSFYVVVFRSVLQANADGDRLLLLDERSHAEAVSSGGLLKYWFGVKNGRRENLATCMLSRLLFLCFFR
jgi:hypothetical protein